MAERSPAEPRYEMHVGDVRQVLATLAPGSVNCVVTSPPYLAKRTYLPAEDPAKPHEIGQESSPADFLAAQLEVMDLLWDVLRDDGVAFVNLGDTASGSGGAGGDYNADGLRAGQSKYAGSNSRRGKIVDHDSGRRTPGAGWPRPKSVCWVPELFGASLAYGRNLLTGEECRRWVTRPSITWCKPNPAVGECIDKFREATELVIFATKSERYWFDLDCLRTPSDYSRPNLAGKGARATDVPGQRKNHSDHRVNENGAPPLNFQVIPPSQYRGSHYATMPTALASMLVRAGCPEGGTVLDPFLGSGTTMEVAHGNGRSCVGIDLDRRNVDLVAERMGFFAPEVIDHLAERSEALGA